MYAVTSFYKFSELNSAQVAAAKAQLEQLAQEQRIDGLLILATEGVNGTICAADPHAIDLFKGLLSQLFGEGNWPFKDSSSAKKPFRRFKIKIRDEIVTTGMAQSPKVAEQMNALTPEQWHQFLQEKNPEEYVVVDTRNHYETELGMFRGAIDPGIVHFKDFPEYVSNSEIPKEKTVLMYCTGGIRCEKAIFQMQELGYSSVYQLQGGILNYLKQYPGQLFDGECFVFDHRVAVDQQLEPSRRWSLCPHCGQPGDVEVQCKRCVKHAKLCTRCTQELLLTTCSKDCENQVQRTAERASK